MSANSEIRTHEAGHAIAALALEIGLQEEAMAFVSDHDSYVNIANEGANMSDENWLIRRAAVKLAGPVASIRSKNEEMSWATLRANHEYASDLSQAERMLRKYWLSQGSGASDSVVQPQLEKAASIAIQVVDQNQAAVSALAEAAGGKDFF